MNLIKIIFPILFMLGCTSCAANLETKDSSVTSSVDDFVTWDHCSQTLTDHPCDFTLKDQNGDDWRLYDHHNSVILIDFSAEWCGWCQVAARTAQEIQDEYADRDVIYVTILVEDSSGNPGSVELSKYWADSFGITAPVLAGDRSMIDASGISGWPVTGWPRFFLINKDMILYSTLSGYNDETLKIMIDQVLADE